MKVDSSDVAEVLRGGINSAFLTVTTVVNGAIGTRLDFCGTASFSSREKLHVA